MLAIAILAAGKGTRMNSDLPKVLHRVNGKPLIAHVLSTAKQLQPDRLIVIVGHGREQVIKEIKPFGVEWVVQEPQLGTAHAILQTESALAGFEGGMVVLSGDVPLLRAETLKRFIAAHRQSGATASVLSTRADDSTGYGRIIRDISGTFARIVEEKEATPEERAVREVNSGVYCFETADFFGALHKVRADNSKGEFYLTDVIGILKHSSRIVQAFEFADFREVRGINTVAELTAAEAGLQGSL